MIASQKETLATNANLYVVIGLNADRIVRPKLNEKPTAPASLRNGDPVRVGREIVTFGRNILVQTGAGFELQHRFFVNDPWEPMAEAIARAVAPGRPRDVAQSFRRQAEDYFRAATTGRELAVRPREPGYHICPFVRLRGRAPFGPSARLVLPPAGRPRTFWLRSILGLCLATGSSPS